MKKQQLTVRLLSASALATTGFFLFSATANADSVVDRAVISVPVSCSMTGSISSGEEHNANIQNGTYRDNIGTTTMTMFCNDGEGFSVYAIGYTNGEYGNTTLTSNTLSSAYDIITGIATGGDISNWAMQLSTDATATYPVTITNGFSSYSPVPSTYTKVATSESNTDSSVQGASFTTTYATYINSTQPASTYSGQVKYTLVHPAIEIPPQPQSTDPGYIAYYPNTNTAEGTMGGQPLQSSDTSITLLASNFSRKGYGFAGWNTAYDYSGDFYGPNETIEFEAGEYTNGDQGLSLYAVWVESDGFIQNWDSCDSLTPVLYNSTTGTFTTSLSNVTALTDLRDNQTYAIARLADGKCWTMENLRLENTAVANSDGSLAQEYNPSFIGLANSESTNFTDSTVANSLYSTDGSGSTLAITGSYAGHRFPRYNDMNIATRDSSPISNNAKIYGFGNYYTWAAAIADTSYYDSGDYNTTSICPTGWHLPTGGSSEAEFSTLDLAMGGTGDLQRTQDASNRWRKYPNNFVFSGYFDNASPMNRGQVGSYWSSTTGSTNGSYYLNIQNDSVYPGTNSYYKYIGQSIRCLTE